MMRKFISLCFAAIAGALSAQKDSTENWSWHYQFTGIMQGHPGFHAPYAGQNSLDSVREKAFSVTSTFYLGRRLWKNGEFYLNPEIAGGKGISSALGIAGFTNGECFRIGDPSPALYLARIFLRQHFALGEEKEWQEADANQLAGWVPSKRITLTAGKFSIADVFDCNSYSHDPRTQFMNWALMSNGAWDYPANTRGYTWGFMAEYIQPGFAARFSETMVPKYANGSVFDQDLSKARGETVELEKSFGDDADGLTIRLLGFRNLSRAGNYEDAITALRNGTDSSMNVNTLTTYGGQKFGFGINIESQILEGKLGMFLRGSWNDGKTATWVFTEIDQNTQVGLNLNGKIWKRNNDELGIAFTANGISKEHQDFLNAGGYGFIIGDGKLPDYKQESIAEVYYSARINNQFWLSLDYQYVQNPAYNADRGPVHVWGVRGHVYF
jgi:high affinity Mn2+ porin